MKNRIRITPIVTLFALVACLSHAFGQENKSLRPSPPVEASKKIGTKTLTINYSQPSVKGRKIWGGLEAYGKVWRAGANEATTFQIDKDSKINGQRLAAGKYAFFVIPNEEKEWVIIFNKVADQWGAFKYDETRDALRVSAKPKKSSTFNEKLVYTIESNGLVTLSWESIQISVQVE